MLIEKVITNFSDVSLWAIALVVGYVLIGAILLLRLAWKRKHTKMENVTQNTPIEQSKEIYRESQNDTKSENSVKISRYPKRFVGRAKYFYRYGCYT